MALTQEQLTEKLLNLAIRRADDDKEIAQQKVESERLLASAVDAVAKAVEGNNTQIASNTATLDSHTKALEARGELWSKTLALVSDRKLLVGFGLGVGISVAVLGPLVLPTLTAAAEVVGLK